MILIVGNNSDDVLYFSSILKNKREETFFKKYHALVGTIYNQPVMLLQDVYTTALSSALAVSIIKEYSVFLIINVGKCYTMSKDINNGDIVISKHTSFLDVNQCENQGIKLGQIPTCVAGFESSAEILKALSETLIKRTNYQFFETTFLSSNTIYSKKEELDKYILEGRILNEDIDKVVFDSEAAGLALAANLCDISFVAAKVVERHLGEKRSIKGYVRILNEYTDLGKAVVNTIGIIGQNDILREDSSNEN